VAKTFVNKIYVERVLKTMITSAYGTEAAMTCAVPQDASSERKAGTEKVDQNIT
jgi:hypothetical protein